MKVQLMLLILLGVAVNLSEGCGSSSNHRSSRRNPKIITTASRPQPVHKFFKQSAFVNSGKDERTCADVNGQCRSACESTEYLKGRFQCGAFTNCCVRRKATIEPEIVSTRKDGTEAPVVSTRKATTEPEIVIPTKESTEAPAVPTKKATTEPVVPTEVDKPTTNAVGSDVKTEEPTTKAREVEEVTKMINALTRPPPVHKFFKQSAFVNSGKDERTCADVNGQCRSACESTEYLKGRFQCGAFTNCCVKR